jgi:hypothetical protein
MQTPDRHELNAGWTIPHTYGIDRLALLPRDPHWLFSYWELTPVLAQKMKEQYHHWREGRFVLRVYNLNTSASKDLDISENVDNWYFSVEDADCEYRVEIGRVLSDGQFVSMLQSNTVRTPRDCISSVIDPRWKMFPFWRQRYYRNFIQGGHSSFEFQSAPSSCEMMHKQ